MSRNKKGPRRTIILRCEEALYAEMLLLVPNMQSIEGFLRYGATQNYFMRLLREDLEKRKQAIRLAGDSHAV